MEFVDYIQYAAVFIYAVLAGLLSVVFGMLVCTAQASAEYIIASVQVLYTRPDGLPSRRHVYAASADSDPARPNYFYGPARSDLRYIWQVAGSRWQGAAGRWRRTIDRLMDPVSLSAKATAPIAVGLAIGLIVALPLAALLAG